MAARVTLRQINATLALLGYAERLVKGRGYFYFTGGNAHNWPSSSVAVYRLGTLGVEWWVRERNDLAAAWSEYR